jgi:GH35 family endo-1,4-beta-xylanase
MDEHTFLKVEILHTAWVGGLLMQCIVTMLIVTATCLPGLAIAQTTFFDGVDDAEGHRVMEEARQRIEEIRKGDFSLTLVDESDTPVTGNVIINQVQHEFLFGAAMRATQALRGNKQMEPAWLQARKVVKELFNVVTVNCHWGPTQPTMSIHDFSETDWMLQWAKENDLQVRGHALVYLNPAAYIPKWTNDIKSTEDWWALLEQHIKAITERYSGDFIEWDYLNEIRFQKPVRESEYPIIPILDDPATAVRIYNICRKYFPDTRLLPLDQVMWTTTETNTDVQQYLQLTRDIIAAGADFKAIGTQCHFYTNLPSFQDGHHIAGPNTFRMKEISKGLDLLTEFNLPVYITEFNPPSRNGRTIERIPVQASLSEAEVAAWSENYYTLAFSKPYIKELTCWFVIDGVGGRGLDAGFVRTDGTLKPLYYTMKKLLTKTWSTNWAGAAKSASTFRGFYGTYEVQAPGYKAQKVELFENHERDIKVVLRK